LIRFIDSESNNEILSEWLNINDFKILQRMRYGLVIEDLSK